MSLIRRTLESKERNAFTIGILYLFVFCSVVLSLTNATLGKHQQTTAAFSLSCQETSSQAFFQPNKLSPLQLLIFAFNCPAETIFCHLTVYIQKIIVVLKPYEYDVMIKR